MAMAKKRSVSRTKKQRPRKVYKKNKTGFFCISFVMISFLVLMSVQVIQLYKKNEDLKIEHQQKSALLEEEKQREEEITAYQKYVTTPEYIEQIARTKLGLVYPNEIIFKEQKDIANQ